MKANEPKSRSAVLIVAIVLGIGMLMFILLLVLPAIFLLSTEESDGFRPPAVYGRDSKEIVIPVGDGSPAPDFFDDLDD